MRIGIYGGTFNPPHVGHVRGAEHALRALKLDRLLVIPSCISPHKELPEGAADPRQRLHMVRLAMEGIPGVEVSDMELRRGGTSYTYETLEALKIQYPEEELVLCMGTDMFLSFFQWREPDRILKNASLGVLYRGDREEKEQVARQKAFMEQKGGKVYLVENPVTEISSTDIRRLLVFGSDAFLPPAVAQYIRQEGLLGTGRDYKNLPEPELEQVVVSLLKPNRVAHVLGCRQAAVELAKLWGANQQDAARAALLHDITKALDGPLQLTLCQSYGILLDAFSQENPKTLHALTGSLVAKRIFGENDAVVAAIRSHTTACADMAVLDEIIYVADYMEPNRDFPGVEKLRRLAAEDLEEALWEGLQMTIAMLRQQGSHISPGSQSALDWLMTKKKLPKG